MRWPGLKGAVNDPRRGREVRGKHGAREARPRGARDRVGKHDEPAQVSRWTSNERGALVWPYQEGEREQDEKGPTNLRGLGLLAGKEMKTGGGSFSSSPGRTFEPIGFRITSREDEVRGRRSKIASRQALVNPSGLHRLAGRALSKVVGAFPGFPGRCWRADRRSWQGSKEAGLRGEGLPLGVRKNAYLRLGQFVVC